ncbi:MAG: sigma factor, partial [Clostridia bacterium]
MFVLPITILAMDEGDDRTFMESLYRTHRCVMYAQALKILRNRQDVDDVVNEACVRLICKISTLRTLDGNILRGYIVSTVKHVALNHIRDTMREQTGEDVAQILEKMPSREDSVEE